MSNNGNCGRKWIKEKEKRNAKGLCKKSRKHLCMIRRHDGIVTSGEGTTREARWLVDLWDRLWELFLQMKENESN